MIELGLSRISRLLQGTNIPWRAIHVAGTNGKGSVCAYASAMLHAGKIRCGRFTSPHLINRWDSIVINEKTVDEALFHQVEALVKARDQVNRIKASEFEIHTAVAFEIFGREQVEVGIIEVGLGGRYDATNLIQNPWVTVITKIGMDHEKYLGDSVEKIASHKAGILKRGAPCIVDATNAPSVLKVIRDEARDINAGPVVAVSPTYGDDPDGVWNILPRETFMAHQQVNICLAVQAVKYPLRQIRPSLEVTNLIDAVLTTVWPGRLQTLNISAISGREEDILLDGAHNVQSAQVLSSYVDTKLRCVDSPVTWMMAFSAGKNMEEILSILLRPGDNIIASRFDPVDGMPWVQAEAVADILCAVENRDIPLKAYLSSSTADALEQAARIANRGPMVVAGSLYQVSDVLRLLSNKHRQPASLELIST